MTPQQALDAIGRLCDRLTAGEGDDKVEYLVDQDDLRAILNRVRTDGVWLDAEEAALAADALDIAASFGYTGDGRARLNARRGALAERLGGDA